MTSFQDGQEVGVKTKELLIQSRQQEVLGVVMPSDQCQGEFQGVISI